ncbi:MAG TPA: magnesium/cobalt transporter CorA [Anaerolineae bacterium]
MIRALYRTSAGDIRTDVKPEDLGAALQDKDGLLWVDFESTPTEVDEPILTNTFHFHPLAVDDALHESHVPKVDDWDDYLYIVLHAAAFDKEAGDHIDTYELDIFLGQNYLVTHHEYPIPAVEKVWAACERESRHWREGPDHLLYRVADEVVASYMPVVEDMDDAIDTIDSQIFDRPSPGTLQRIFALKHATVHLRRTIAPQREVLNKLARDEYDLIDRKDRVYFRDVYDHLVRLHDITEGMRDLAGGALDTYLSVVNNRMNDIMKTLTVVTTLFMPLTFITGFFGMNFFQSTEPTLDPWTSLVMLIITLAIMVVLPISMLIFIRRRGWL